MKLKKIAAGHYETKMKNSTFIISKNSSNFFWTVRCGKVGDYDYLLEIFPNKKQCVDFLKKQNNESGTLWEAFTGENPHK